jgi:hypothetical protein
MLDNGTLEEARIVARVQHAALVNVNSRKSGSVTKPFSTISNS